MGTTGDPSSKSSWLPLVTAADDGYQKCVRSLLEHGANPDVCGPDGIDTPLRYAAVNGHLEICRLLLEHGADVNSPLIKPPILIEVVVGDEIVSISRKVEILKLLLQNGAMVNATDGDGWSALTWAATKNREPLARCLLDHAAEVNPSSDMARPLFHASRDHNRDLVELLLHKGADANHQDSEGRTALHVAHPSSEITRLLLERGANPDLQNKRGLTELMIVASNGYNDCVEQLLKHKAAIDIECDRDNSDWAGWTAVSFASSYGYPDTVRLLGEAGADLKHKAKGGSSPIHLAVKGTALRSLMEFIGRVDLDQVDDDGNTALHLIRDDDLPFANIKLLVNAGANLDIQNSVGETPLTSAAFIGRQDAVSLFLKQDVDINLASKAEGAALHQACRGVHIEIAKMLVEHGADVNLLVPRVGRPLECVCFTRASNENTPAKDLVRFLLENGADVNAPGGELGSPISAAALGNMPSVVRLLLEEKATTNVRDGFGRMPIHFAAVYGISNFQLILAAGGDIKARDKMGRTALHWAAQTGRSKVVELILSLLPREAVDERDIDGWTPLCWAARGNGTSYIINLDIDSDGEEDQRTVIQLLLEHGADRLAECSIGEQRWSPLRLAFYGQADSEVINLLKNGLEGERSDALETAAAEPGDDLEQIPPSASYRFSHCHACLWSIYGIAYKCETCIDFEFCSKCYNRRDILHADHPEHTFQEVGPEFEVPSVSGSSDAGRSLSSDSSSDFGSETSVF